MTPTTKLDEARELVAAIDKHTADIALYVGPGDDPVESLIKVRSFLAANASTKTVALAVIALDRVLDQLCKFRMRVTLERTEE